ncbi:MAG: hypothetical protein ACI88H_001328 [Cocleimonas sp.]|jgi:hypothetical protein
MMMSELQRIQQNMMAFLISKDKGIEFDVVNTKTINAIQRLSIYGDGYGYRLHDALSENHPAVHTLLGDHDFFKIAYEYIDSFPSQHFYYDF